MTFTPRPEEDFPDNHEITALFEAARNYFEAGHEHLTPVIMEVHSEG